MKHRHRIILCPLIAVVLLMATGLHAQQASRWSVYGGGAVGLWQGVGSPLYEGTAIISPSAALGVSWQWHRAWRLSAEASYDLLRERNNHICSTVVTDNNFELGGHQTTLTTQADLLQNKNRQHLAGLQLTTEYGLRLSPLTIYAGGGVGIVSAQAVNTRTTAYNAEAIAEGEGYYNVYQHAYVKSETQKERYTTLSVPVSLTAECDVLPNVAIGLRGQLRWLPLNTELAPKSIYGGGLLLRIKL